MVGRSVDEIIALAGSDRLLAGLVDPDPSWLIVDDLDEAWRWASKVPIPVEVPNVGSNLNWGDFQAIAVSPLGSQRPGVLTFDRLKEISDAIRVGFDLPVLARACVVVSASTGCNSCLVQRNLI